MVQTEWVMSLSILRGLWRSVRVFRTAFYFGRSNFWYDTNKTAPKRYAKKQRLTKKVWNFKREKCSCWISIHNKWVLHSKLKLFLLGNSFYQVTREWHVEEQATGGWRKGENKKSMFQNFSNWKQQKGKMGWMKSSEWGERNFECKEKEWRQRNQER